MAKDGRIKRRIFGLILYLKYKKNLFHLCNTFKNQYLSDKYVKFMLK